MTTKAPAKKAPVAKKQKVKKEVKTLEQLSGELAAVQAKAAEAAKAFNAEERAILLQGRKKALAQVRKLVSGFGLTPDEIFKEGTTEPKPSGSKAPKYQDPETKTTWAGTGRQPKWMPANKKDWPKFLIKKEA